MAPTPAQANGKKNGEETSVWSTIDVQIERFGTKVVLPDSPEPMKTDDAITFLQRVSKQEKQEYDVHEVVKGAPWDAMVALTRAMQNTYGVILAESIKTFFGDIHPDLISVIVGCHGETLQIPQGQMRLPNIDNPVHIQMGRDGAHITGTFKRHEKETIVKIRMQADKLLRSESIYKGKAIKYNVDDDGDLVLTEQPEFIDLSLVSESDMIHTHHTAKAIENSVFAPLRHTDNCRRLHIPLKRGVLLFGKYGTGKSLTARVTAKVAEDNGWTFIMLNKSQGLKSAIEFAKMYQPCVIFAEDIDRCADREEESVNDLVNTLDGLINKNDEIITVLTTNFIEKIDKALLRPGRFDALIHIEPPDAETSIKIVYAYAQNLIEPDTNLAPLGEVLAGKIPALIREVVERAKLSMLTEGRKALTYDDLDTANTLLNKHQELLEAEPKELSPAETFFQSWKAMVSEAIHGVEDMEQFADNMICNMNEVQRVMRARFTNMDKRLDATQTAAMGAGSAASDAKKLTQKLLQKMGISAEV